MTQTAASVKAPRMGRPPLGASAEQTKMLHIRVEEVTLERIRAAQLPSEKVASFIRGAIERELERRESSAGPAEE